MLENENQRIRLTKRLLHDSLIKLLEEKSIAKITISKLCADAGINRSTFYNHYGSQYDVLDEVGRELAEKLYRSGAKSAENSLSAQVACICRCLKGNRREAEVLLKNFDADSAVIQELFRQRITQQPEYVRFLAACDEDMKTLLNTFMINGVYSLICKWLLEDVPKTPEEIGELAQRMAAGGWLKNDKK